MKTNGKCDGTDSRNEYARCDDKNGIPQDDARDFKCSHPGVVHRGDATGDDGAANPWPVAPVRNEGHSKPCAGQQDGRD